MSERGATSRPGYLTLSFNREPPVSPPMMRIVMARGFFARLRGLLGTSGSWGNGNTALLIPQCRSVHTFGMRYPLDITFVDERGIVMRTERNVAPGRLLSCKDAVLVLERPYTNDDDWLTVGERLQILGNAPTRASRSQGNRRRG